MDVREAFTNQREHPELVARRGARLVQMQEWVMAWRLGDPSGLGYRGEVAPEPEPRVTGNLQPATKE